MGDHIESINGENIVGWRHFDVAKKLKELKKEELFTMKLIEPKKAFEIEPRSKAGNISTGKIGTGRETLRLRSKGPATVEEVVGYAHLVTILLGHEWTPMAIRAGKRGKTTRLSEMPYILIKARTLIHCLLNRYEHY